MRKSLLLLSFLFSILSILNAQVAICTVNGAKLQVDTNYLEWQGDQTIIEDAFFTEVLSLNGNNQAMQVKKVPNASFAMAFWMRFDEIEQTATIFTQVEEKEYFQLQLDHGFLLIQHYKNGYEGLYQSSKSEHQIIPGHWYYFNYSSHKGDAFLKVLSTNFKFEAFFPLLSTEMTQIYLGKDSSSHYTEACLHQFQLFQYSESIYSQLSQPYDKLELELYTYHSHLKKESRAGRSITMLEPVTINKKAFYFDIWDYDEIDNDSLRLIPKKGLKLYDKKGKVEEKVVRLNEQTKRRSFQVRISEEQANELVFSASSMGFIEKFNTATVKIHTADEELWDTIHIKPNFDTDIQLNFKYDPSATPPAMEIDPIEVVAPSINYSGLNCKSQKLLLKISDYSIPDKDLIRIQLNKQPPILSKPLKKEQDILFALDRKSNLLQLQAASTGLFYCSAKVELFEVIETGSSRKIYSENLKMKKGEIHKIPISFSPKPLREHALLVRDNKIRIRISDPQLVDGDSIRVVLNEEVLLEKHGLTDQEEVLELSIDNTAESTLYFIPIHKGENTRAANLCKVIIENSSELILAEYELQMLHLNEPGIIRLSKIK